MMNKTFIISGEVHGGKTTYAAGLSKRLTDNGLQVTGFVCPGTFKNNHRNAFDLKFLHSGQQMPFARAGHVDGWINYKRFSFNPEALCLGTKQLDAIENSEQTVVFVDEIGQWELEDGGWAEAIIGLMQKKKTMKILVVRKKFISKILEKFKIDSPIIFDIQQTSFDAACEHIMHFNLTH